MKLFRDLRDAFGLTVVDQHKAGPHWSRFIPGGKIVRSAFDTIEHLNGEEFGTRSQDFRKRLEFVQLRKMLKDNSELLDLLSDPKMHNEPTRRAAGLPPLTHAEQKAISHLDNLYASDPDVFDFVVEVLRLDPDKQQQFLSHHPGMFD